jgi:hypothetical protein
MDLRIPATATFLAAAIALAFAAPALAAPAGDEYLPKVPKAAGGSASHDQGSGANSSAGSEPSDTGSSDSQSQGAAVPAGGGKPPSDGDKQGKTGGEAAPAPIVSAPASSSDDSSDSTLFSPVIILLLAGVLIAAVGMTLRRRNAEADERQEGPRSGRSEPGNTPPTPDGEIVAGEKAR